MRPQPSKEAWIQGDEATCSQPYEPHERVYRLVLLGPPGVGKGTQAKLICNRMGTCHLSTGDLFRANQCVDKTSTAMTEALAAMRRGELVSDELVMSMIRERANCLRCGGGFLLDGVPRTLDQAKSLEQTLGELDIDLQAVISYELPLDEIVDRLGGRRTCTSCKAVYHVSSNPPQVQGVCNECGSELMQRDDDRPEAIRVRMQTYTEATQPVSQFYAERGLLVTIDANGTPEEIAERTFTALKTHLGVAEL